MVKSFIIQFFLQKLIWVFLRKDNQDVYNSKTVEILAAGGFMLSEYSPYIEEIFKNNKELVFFNDNKLELLKSVKYFLKTTN